MRRKTGLFELQNPPERAFAAGWKSQDAWFSNISETEI
jgi:hypothetical protein